MPTLSSRVVESTRKGQKIKQNPVVPEELARELEAYKGRWVAVFQGKLVGVADSASGAQVEALKRGITDPIVFRVPSQAIGLASFR